MKERKRESVRATDPHQARDGSRARSGRIADADTHEAKDFRVTGYRRTRAPWDS